MVVNFHRHNLIQVRKCEYLIVTKVRRCIPRVKGAVPKVELKPPEASASIERIASAWHCAVALGGSCPAVVRNIRDVTTP